MKEQGHVYIEGAINGAGMVDHGDFVTFPCVATAEGVFNGGESRKIYRPAEVVKAAAPFCNGLRAIINHPPVSDPARMACIDLNDKDFPVLGWFSNAKAGSKDGVARIVGELNIFKNRNGRDNTKVIRALQTKTLKGDVSIGYFFTSEKKTGTFRGENYDTVETEINPYHLAILDGFDPAFKQPLVGIGACWDPGANPYPNWHSARVNDPGKYDSFSNVDNSNPRFKGLPDGMEVVLGIKGDKSEVQAYRFDKDKFTAAQARAWLKANKVKFISFEPATTKPGSKNDNGGSSMANEGEEQDSNGNKPKEQPAPKDLSLEALAGQNAHVLALVNEKKALQDQVAKMEKDLAKAKDDAKTGAEAVKKLETQKAEARKARVEAIKKAMTDEQFKELFGEDAELAKVGDEELVRLEKIAMTAEVPVAAEAGETNEEKAPKASPAFKAPTKKTTPSPGANEDERYLPSVYTPPVKRGAKKDGQ